MSIRVYLTELKRSWLELARYPLATLGEIIVVTLVFYGLFLGASYLSNGADFGQRLEDTVVGYAAFVFLMATLTTLTWEIQREALTGTLEQLLLTPFGLPRVLLHRAVAKLGLNLLTTALILIVLGTLMRTDLEFRATIAVPIATALIGAYGLGLILAGLALVFKRIDQVTQLLQFALMFLLIAPLETFPSARWISGLAPLSPSVGMLRDIMVRGGGIDPVALAIAALNSLAYLVCGVAIFYWALRVAKTRGVVAGY